MEKYDIMDVIDEGAYGIVWKATNRETGGIGTYQHSESPSRNSKKPTRTSSAAKPSNARSRCSKCS